MRALAVAILAVMLVSLACGPTVVAPSPTSAPTVAPTPEPTSSPSPTPSPSPTRTQVPDAPPIPSPCDGQDPKRGIAQVEKFTLLDRCRTVQGVVASIAGGTDGGLKMRLVLDYGQASTLNLRNMTELSEQLPATVVCNDPVPLSAIGICGDFKVKIGAPTLGAHVSITGPLVLDTSTGVNAIQPVWGIKALTVPPPTIPASVAQAKQLWQTIRENWPAIPPAIILAEGPAGAVASASLYPDGIAHVFVGDQVVEPHVLWHEAGHILHAAVLKQRGKLEALFSFTDDVGIAFWAARGFPSSWQGSLTTGSWQSLGYEALAEAFAAVNTGDDERTVTYGIALDRNAMRVFFANLVLNRV